MSKALKPCPFCGSKDVKLLNPDGSRIYQMLCCGCFCRTDEFDTKEDAFKTWNTRASEVKE